MSGLRRAGAAEDSPTIGSISGRPTQSRRAMLWLRNHLWGLGSVVGGLLLWETLVRGLDASTLLIAPPSAILERLVEMARDGELWEHSSVSAKQFFLGYVGCALIAVPLGLLMGSVKALRRVLEPWISALYATPSIALAPLFIIWLGFGISSKAAIVALVAFFPIVINTIAGVDSLERHYFDVGYAFSANRRELFVKVLLPGCVPWVFTGLRLASARGLVGLVAADLFGARAGLGYLILISAQRFDTTTLFAATTVLAVSGVLINTGLVRLEHYVSPWRRSMQ